MSIEAALDLIPTYVLVFFRLTGMMIFAPLFGSSRIPKRMRMMFALVAALGMMAGAPAAVKLPDELWKLVIVIAGEMFFGLAMGMIVSLIFVSAQWAGDLIGQQIGFNMAEVFDPTAGANGTVVSEFYYMLTLVVFLTLGGHRIMLHAVFDSFSAAPLMSLGIDQSVLTLMTSMLTSATTLAMRLAAPMFFTMLVTDLAMGIMGRAMPQLNIMTAGMSVKAIVGIVVMLIGVTLSSDVLRASMQSTLDDFSNQWVPVVRGNK